MNKQTLDFIKKFEGEVLRVYKDPVGLWTLGCGHLLTPGEKKTFKLGQKISRELSDEYLTKDLTWAAKAVETMVKVPLTENQKTALISLTFNIGKSAFARSSCLAFLNKGNYKISAQRILLWNTAQGKVLKGLVRRREAEKALFESN